MAQTKLTNLFNPQVVGDLIATELPKKIKMAPFAVVDNTLQGVAGNTITIPKFAYIGEAEVVAEGVAAGTVVLTATTAQATVKKAVKAVEITDEAALSGYGDPVGEAVRQITMALADKVDSDCMEAAAGATNIVDKSTAKIGYEAIVDALDAFAGAQVVVSRKVKDLGSGVYACPIMKAGALALYMKRGVNAETDRNVLASTTVLKADEHYVAAIKDESKIVVLKAK